jgi:hypothetical protein
VLTKTLDADAGPDRGELCRALALECQSIKVPPWNRSAVVMRRALTAYLSAIAKGSTHVNALPVEQARESLIVALKQLRAKRPPDSRQLRILAGTEKLFREGAPSAMTNTK